MARVTSASGVCSRGVRVEETDADFAGNEMPIRNGVFQGPRRVKGNAPLHRCLPGLHLRGTPTKDLCCAPRGLTRSPGPNYNDLSPSRDFDYT